MVVETCRTNSQVKCAAIWDATNLQLNSAGLQKPFLAALAQTTGSYSVNHREHQQSRVTDSGNSPPAVYEVAFTA